VRNACDKKKGMARRSGGLREKKRASPAIASQQHGGGRKGRGRRRETGEKIAEEKGRQRTQVSGDAGGKVKLGTWSRGPHEREKKGRGRETEQSKKNGRESAS